MVADGYLKYGFDTIGEAAADIRKFITEMDQELEQVESKFNSQREHWSGATQAAFEPAHQKWNKNAKELSTTLLQIAAALEGAGLNMKSTDQKYAALFDQ
ncbi:MAG: WXG100 family type VII secretion target [Micromonosporaceae bacterium]